MIILAEAAMISSTHEVEYTVAGRTRSALMSAIVQITFVNHSHGSLADFRWPARYDPLTTEVDEWC